jgi:hypothetical protein
MSKHRIFDRKTDCFTRRFVGYYLYIKAGNPIFGNPTFSSFQTVFLYSQVLHFCLIIFYHCPSVVKLGIHFFSEFCELNPTDQQKVLAKSTPLFIQLYIGQFLLVEPRHTPATADKHPKKVWINNFDQNRYLERFNAATNIFVLGADLHEYGGFIAKLKDLPELTTFKQKAILAHIILFGSDERITALSHLNLDLIFNDYIRSCEHCSSLFSLTENLKVMAEFCAKNIVW